nr:putative integron gene cassette protein [uncultured bacterium]
MDLSEVTVSGADKQNERKRSIRSQPTQRMRGVSAQSGLDRRSNVPKNRPKSNANRSRNAAALTTQLPNAFLPPNA